MGQRTGSPDQRLRAQRQPVATHRDAAVSGRSVSGGKVELVLGIRPCRGDGRSPCGQADTLQIALNRTWIGERSHDLHVTAAGGALSNVYSKDSPEEVGPGQGCTC